MKALITLFFITLLAITGVAQNSWTTQITPNNSVEYATKLIKTQDGGYVTVLNRVDTMVNFSANIEYNKIAIVKLDANGNIVFNKTINVKDSSLVRVNDFIELPTGDFIIVGDIYSPNGQSLMIKTDAQGDTLWTEKLNQMFFKSLVNLSTNKFWTCSGPVPPSSSEIYYFIYEYDYNGNLLNINYQDTMVILNSFTTKPRLFKDINDSVFVVGEWKGEGLLSKKMDPFFNKYPLNQTVIPGTGIASDGSLLGGSGGGLYKVTGRLDSIWLHPASEYEFSWGAGTSQSFTKIKPTADGGFITIGNATNGIADNIFLIKTDALGNKEFGKMYWAVTSNNIDVVQANDGGYVMLQAGAGVWVVKARIDGTIGVAENNYFAKHEVKIYPNPTANQITLAFDQLTSGQIHLFNLTGQQVLTEQITQTKTHQISVADLPKGVYFVTIKTENTTITKKIIKN